LRCLFSLLYHKPVIGSAVLWYASTASRSVRRTIRLANFGSAVEIGENFGWGASREAGSTKSGERFLLHHE
jgi:hypothetical protein